MEISVNSYKDDLSKREGHLYVLGDYDVLRRWEDDIEKVVYIDIMDTGAQYIEGVSFHSGDHWHCEIIAGNYYGLVELYNMDDTQSEVSEEEAMAHYARLLEALVASKPYKKVL